MNSTRLRIALATAAAGSLAAAVPAFTIPTTADAATATPWASTATKALQLKNATSLGAAPATTPLHLTIGLAPRNQGALDALIAAQATPGSSSYHHYLTPAQFTATYAATSAQAQAVTSYLRGAGLSHVAVSSNRLQVTADATVAQAQKAFHTQISRFSQGGKTVLANVTAAQVPTALAGTVTGVLGLTTLGAGTGPAAVGPPKLSGFYPDEFPAVYDAGNTSAGDGTTLAVIAQGDLTGTVQDLRTFEDKRGLPHVPVDLQYLGGNSGDTAGADEWNLDTQTSTGAAPDAKSLSIYVAPTLEDADLATAINAFAAQDTAQTGSASLGECDVLASLSGFSATADASFAEAAAQGQTFFASSGDTGSSCAVLPTNGVPASGPPDTEYPASSTYVVGVGGTTLLTDDSDAYTGEITWYGGGGGISPVGKPGAWQQGVVPTSAAGLRGVPDVAFDADPTTGALIIVDGQEEQIGGTSLASPLAMGLWTRIESSHDNSLGFASPLLYNLYKSAQTAAPLPPTTAPAAFHDVIAGANGLYAATPGWDYTTGLGSWDVAKLSAALK